MAGSGEEEKKYSTSELMASAKIVAEAAQSGLGKETDKAKVADAAGDLLEAVGQYAKLDDQKGVGQYVDKASDYLHQYQSTNSPAPSPSPSPAAAAAAPSKPDHPNGNDDAPAKSEGGGLGGLGGDFAKVAGGFFK
ncbi:nodulin-related protein 1-like [Cicer arietinum]|uniref:Nodulin-related protein 1-like n=1 Tax=Cicer arietinum TaxID=3827 RepID=A0A1S2YIQ0_CICAR|nr:nodulin-related protein 1-like [Cicer arietinum]